MNKFLLKFVLIFSFVSVSFGNTNRICRLPSDIVNRVIFTYNYAKKFKSPNEMTFNNAISTIFLLETNAGEEWLGDIDKSSEDKIINNLVEGSFGPGQIKLSTALLMIKSFPYLKEKYGYLYHKNIYSFQIYNKYFKKMAYYYKILNSRVWNKRWEKGNKLEVKKWAMNEYKYWENKYKKYLEISNKDLKIIQMLKNNYKFSIEIGTSYLIYNYLLAIKKKLPHPYYKAISAYNGGWNNKRYLKRFFKYKKYIDCLKKEGFIN